MIRGYYDTLRLDHVPENPEHGIFFDQDWASLPARHAGRLGRDPRRPDAPAAAVPRRGRRAAVRRRDDRPPDGHRRRRDRQPGGRRGDDPGAQRGPRLLHGGPGHPRARRQGLPRARTRRSRCGRTSRSTSSPPTRPTTSSRRRSPEQEAKTHAHHPGHVLVPARSSPTSRSRPRSATRCTHGWAMSVEHTDDPHPRNPYWEMWGTPMFDLPVEQARRRRCARCAPAARRTPTTTSS